MNMAELLRGLADKLDGIEKGGETDRPANTGPTADHFQHDVDGGAESGDKDVKLDMDPVMVPPLQAKLEILKKSEGMPNVYDEQGDEGNSELAVIKKNAGLTAAQHEASEDNDVLG
jgi:hypothetical protein